MKSYLNLIFGKFSHLNWQTDKMSFVDKKVAILVPSAPYGAYWPPILGELNKKFQQLRFFTGCLWPKYDPEAFGASVIQLVGKTRLLAGKENPNGYGRVLILASPVIVPRLIQFNPDIVFVSGFSIWTLLTLSLKPIFRWKVVLVYEGSAPNVDFLDSPFRLFFRRLMAKFADLYISNSQSGKQYLVDVLNIDEKEIYARPYMVPDSDALLERNNKTDVKHLDLKQPTFLFIGQIVPRKGVHLLLDACMQLKEKGYNDYKVLIVGDGIQRHELENLAFSSGLSCQISWLGWLAYGELGSYIQAADVFVFPSLEDTWGMAVLEAMAFGKAIICSKWAGAQEMVTEGENGFIVNPHCSNELSEAMAKFIVCPQLISEMGANSKELIAHHTPNIAADFLADMASKVMQ